MVVGSSSVVGAGLCDMSPLGAVAGDCLSLRLGCVLGAAICDTAEVGPFGTSEGGKAVMLTPGDRLDPAPGLKEGASPLPSSSSPGSRNEGSGEAVAASALVVPDSGVNTPAVNVDASPPDVAAAAEHEADAEAEAEELTDAEALGLQLGLAGGDALRLALRLAEAETLCEGLWEALGLRLWLAEADGVGLVSDKSRPSKSNRSLASGRSPQATGGAAKSAVCTLLRGAGGARRPRGTSSPPAAPTHSASNRAAAARRVGRMALGGYGGIAG